MAMDIKVEKEESSSQEIQEEQSQSLLAKLLPKKQPKTRTQKAIRKTFKCTSHLSSLLPSGSVLIFEFLSPILTNRGECQTPQNRLTTLGLLTFVSFSCFIMCFTDSVRDERGKVRYGLATFKGIWILDGSVTLGQEEQARYRIRFLDFLHAFMGISIFMGVALLDQNVVKCFFPMPSEKTKQFLVMLPVGIGIVCSLLFVCFPSKRNGIVSPLSKS